MAVPFVPSVVGPTRAKGMSDSLSENIVAYARMHGWRCVHFRPARTGRTGKDGKAIWNTPFSGDAGFPDIILVRGSQMLFIEAKSGRDKLRPDQEAWRDALIEAGADWRLWTNEAWQRGEYDAVLGEPRGAN